MQGPDGSRLIASGGRDDDWPLDDSRPAPPELMQLLAVEDRMRRLRHLQRIATARDAAWRSKLRLAELRQHPVKRAAVRLTQLAGMAALGKLAYNAAAEVHHVLTEEQFEFSSLSNSRQLQPATSARAPSTGELRSLWEASQPIVDLLLQAAALRAIRSRVAPKVANPDMHVPDVALEDVAGIGPAKAEALEIVECLMAPARFAGLGARCPKGLLLTGPPGCGKTLLAKAIASAASVPFISRSGADFNRIFAGAGSNLVKELFRAAREVAPAVILIDELDYIGRRRGEERGGGLETDRSAALTQLLAEMDGFSSSEGVVVIGTTNRPDILDKALLRPGRFDRKVVVPLPDVEGRLKILRKHASRLALEQPDAVRLTGPLSAGTSLTSMPVDWPAWAKRTPGWSGADLAGMVNEAAMAAAREGARGVGERHVQAAYNKQLMGVPSERRPSRATQEITAAHEAGHAVVNEVMRVVLGIGGATGFRTVSHISIVPVGTIGGITQFAEPDEGSRLPETRRVLLADLAVTMGGRAGEEMRLGSGEVTMGASSDYDQATRRAYEMVTMGGLSEVVGPRKLDINVPISEETKSKLDSEVNKLLRNALATAREALTKNRGLTEAVASALMERETLDAETFKRLVQQHPVTPVKL